MWWPQSMADIHLNGTKMTIRYICTVIRTLAVIALFLIPCPCLADTVESRLGRRHVSRLQGLYPHLRLP